MKRIAMVFTFLLSLVSVLGVTVVQADDDDHREYYEEEWEHEEEHDDERYKHDDDDDDFEEYDRVGAGDVREATRWYFWMKESTSMKGELPFTEPKRIVVEKGPTNEQITLYILPNQGELLVPGKEVSAFLGAQTRYYPTSRILEVKKEQTELIYRAGSNAVYENMTKTPMPAKAVSMNGDVYLPISVVANGLGFSVEWNEKNQVIHLQPLIP